MRIGAAAALALGVATAQVFNIDSYGAIAGVDTLAAARTNGAAFLAALVAANASAAAQRGAAAPVVLVPAAEYAYLPAAPAVDGLAGVTVEMAGAFNLYTLNFTSDYPGFPSNPWQPLSLTNCANVTLQCTTNCTGSVWNGRGNAWWWFTILAYDARPGAMLHISQCTGLTVTGLRFLNAPAYHIYGDGLRDALFEDVTVLVDIADQLGVYRYMGGASESDDLRTVLRKAGRVGPVNEAENDVDYTGMAKISAPRGALPPHLSSFPWFNPAWRVTPPIPMVWALNTDGIDVAGNGIVVRNCHVTNFDDSVCVKPTSGIGQCSSNILFENNVVVYGVGATMGSVPPDAGGNCISDVIVRNHSATYPLKAIYIKPNPAKPFNATGLISNVLYEDITIVSPLWWAVWIGTQQQAQPGGGANTGCSFLYPIDPTCPTDPQVTVANITLRRVNVSDPLLSPGIIIANASNPFTGFVFEDVLYTGNISTWPVNGWLCTNTHGIANGTTWPVPSCMMNHTRALL